MDQEKQKQTQTEIALLIRGEDPNVVMMALTLTEALKEEQGGPERVEAWTVADVAGIMDLARTMVKLESEE